MRYNRPAQIDKNQPQIVKIYRSLGALVLLTHTLKNCCDIIVTYRGQTQYVEIKDPKAAEFPKYFFGLLFEEREKYIVEKALTDGERKFREEVLSRGGIYSIVYDRGSALRSLGLKT
jgi:hypothetical protein